MFNKSMRCKLCKKRHTSKMTYERGNLSYSLFMKLTFILMEETITKEIAIKKIGVEFTGN